MAIRLGVGRALARFSHALQLVSEVEPVADRSPKGLGRWLAETLEIRPLGSERDVSRL
jgi:hypothetical protein